MDTSLRVLRTDCFVPGAGLLIFRMVADLRNSKAPSESIIME